MIVVCLGSIAIKTEVKVFRELNSRSHQQQVTNCDLPKGWIAFCQFRQVIGYRIIGAVYIAIVDGCADQRRCKGFCNRE